MNFKNRSVSDLCYQVLGFGASYSGLEKEMATHSSFLAWRIPWTEELAGLQSMGRKESDMTERLHFHFHYSGPWGFPGGSVVKNPLANAGDASSIPGLGRSPGEGNGNPLQLFLPGKSHGQRSLVGYI